MNALIHSWKKWLRIGLEEDGFNFDWTARATARSRGAQAESQTSATLISKGNGIWAADKGLRAVELLSEELGIPIQVKNHVQDGRLLAPGQKICDWLGSSEAIVTFERSFINLASYTSGISTATAQLVERVRVKGMKNPPRITATRKTLPGYRDLAIESTLIGGARPHRFNLSGGLLLKENHIAAAGSIGAAIANAREVIPHLLKIEIEVKNLDELREAILAGAEVIMLDNFNPEQVREAIHLKPVNGVCFEVSGGINLQNLDTYLIEGLDVISVGALTHSVKALDLSLLMNGVSG